MNDNTSNVATPPPGTGRVIRRENRPGATVVLTFDRPGSVANILDRPALRELDEQLQWIAEQPGVRGLVITTAKKSVFVAGADLDFFLEHSETELREYLGLGQRLLNRLAALPIPTVALIHGAALGGGFEICLACDWRVASDDTATRIGLPETTLGLIPAWGGCTRLPQLVGLVRAMDVIFGGKPLSSAQALAAGLVDEVAAREEGLAAAMALLAKGKRPAKPNGFAADQVESIRTAWQPKVRGHDPAPAMALQVITQSASLSVEASLQLELDNILALLRTRETRNLIRHFQLRQRAKKLAVPGTASLSEADRTASRKLISNVLVVGAGVMGSGIAHWLSSKGCRVWLHDSNARQLAKSATVIAGLYDEAVARRRLSQRDADEAKARVGAAESLEAVPEVDLVIEAAVEKLDVKQALFRSLDERFAGETVLATNTSALSVFKLAEATRWPERVLGLHFFNPVSRMQLVEVVAARRTSPVLLQRALGFVQRIGKLPVLVRDNPGFIVNRVLFPYLLEAVRLFEDGVPAEEVDDAMLSFGMPMGPLRLLDEVGLDVSCDIAATLAASFGARMEAPAVLMKLREAGQLGRKAGRGFYLYAEGSKKLEVNPTVPSPVRTGRLFKKDSGDMQSRMTLPLVNEAACCGEENVTSEPADIDFALMFGAGFPAVRGGSLRYADWLDASYAVVMMRGLVRSGLPHFESCALLREMAADSQGRYYPGQS